MVDERMKIVIIAFLVFIAVAEGIALATAGTEDFGAFIFWTIPSAAIICVSRDCPGP